MPIDVRIPMHLFLGTLSASANFGVSAPWVLTELRLFLAQHDLCLVLVRNTWDDMINFLYVFCFGRWRHDQTPTRAGNSNVWIYCGFIKTLKVFTFGTGQSNRMITKENKWIPIMEFGNQSRTYWRTSK